MPPSEVSKRIDDLFTLVQNHQLSSEKLWTDHRDLHIKEQQTLINFNRRVWIGIGFIIIQSIIALYIALYT